MRFAALLFALSLSSAAAAQVPGTAPGAQPEVQPGVQPGIAPPPAEQIPGPTPGVVSGVLPASGYKIIPSKVEPAATPGQILLIQLEGKFAAATAEGGGKAFSQWFAEDAVTLSNGKPAVLGRGAIAAQANWSPKDYTLTWTPQGAQMGPSNDMGFTWGHYEGKSMSLDGKPVVTAGRYITIWKKQPNGEWKVTMDASAEEQSQVTSEK